MNLQLDMLSSCFIATTKVPDCAYLKALFPKTDKLFGEERGKEQGLSTQMSEKLIVHCKYSYLIGIYRYWKEISYWNIIRVQPNTMCDCSIR